jgi:hypothetical protein
MKYLIFFLFLSVGLWSRTFEIKTNYLIQTNNLQTISTNYQFTKRAIIPVRKTKVKTILKTTEVIVTNYVPLYYSVYETNTITITNEVAIDTAPKYNAYKQYSLISTGYSYCGRLLLGYDVMNILSSDSAGVGLGFWGTWNTMHFPNHQLDLGLKFNVSF